jgi:hypothetical protein
MNNQIVSMYSGITLVVFLSIIFPHSASAQEGTGVHGANRRVTAEGGYGMIKASFTTPDSYIVNYSKDSIDRSKYGDNYSSKSSRYISGS